MYKVIVTTQSIQVENTLSLRSAAVFKPFCGLKVQSVNNLLCLERKKIYLTLNKLPYGIIMLTNT